MSGTGFIFDVDGTLYDFDGVSGRTFGESRFCSDLQQRVLSFISDRLQIDTEEAEEVIRAIGVEYGGETSIGVEKRFGIDRGEFFEATWSCDPTDYLVPNLELSVKLRPFIGRSAVLSAAPRIWVDRVLEYFDIEDVFGGRIVTGEPDIRKPDSRAFLWAVDLLGVDIRRIISIGDQDKTDIVPAKLLGMRALRIGRQIGDADWVAPTLISGIKLLSERGLA